MGTDFNLYSTFQDAQDNTNEWEYCKYHNHVGMPYECGPTEKVRNQWAKMLWPSGRLDVAFYILKEEGTSLNRQAISGGEDIRDPVLTGDAYEIDGKSYLTAAGQGIWWGSDQFYFLPNSGTTDIKLKVHILSSTGPQYTLVGLMIRESLDAEAKNVGCFLQGTGKVSMQKRLQHAGSTNSDKSGNLDSDSVWLQLEKQGNTYTCSWSVDGNDWSTGITKTVDLADVFKYGMAMTSHDQYKIADAFYEDFSEEVPTSAGAGAVPRGRGDRGTV